MATLRVERVPGDICQVRRKRAKKKWQLDAG